MIKNWISKVKQMRLLSKHSGEYYEKATPIMEEVVASVENMTDPEAMAFLTYVITEMIIGFDDKDARKGLIKLITELESKASKKE